MIITVASGKGGTGKTTIATGLALTLLQAAGDPALRGRKLAFADCDVAEPNAASILNPLWLKKEAVSVSIPQVDTARCTRCGRCDEVCAYHAIVVMRDQVLVFPELCCGCGSCSLVCPAQAIREVRQPIGVVEKGRVGSMVFVQGATTMGIPLATPIVREVKQWATDPKREQVILVDTPSTLCASFVQSLRGSDYVLIVAESSPAGLRGFRAVVDIARALSGARIGAILNDAGSGDDGWVEKACREAEIPLLLRIPFDRRIAEASARGEPVASALPEFREALFALYRRIVEEVTA